MKKLLRTIALLYLKPWIRWFLISFILIIFWISFSLLFSSTANFFTVVKNYNTDSIKQAPTGKLMKGESIVGEFNATENNLGIVSVRFGKMSNVDYENQDTLVFQIKEKGAKNWWYQNVYKSGGIYGLPLYPFGFPKITDSKGKTYIFVITSLSGNNTNAVRLNKENPILVSKYVFTKTELLANKKMFIQFIYKKLINSFTDINFLKSSLTYALPLGFYLFWYGIITRLRADRYSFILVSPLLIFLAIVIHIDRTIGFFLALVGIWCITINTYKVESSVSYFFAFLYLVFAFFMILSGFQDIGSRLSDWTYIFLIIGTVQLFGEFKEPDIKRLRNGELLDSIYQRHLCEK